jgi:hypothetical protein
MSTNIHPAYIRIPANARERGFESETVEARKVYNGTVWHPLEND